MFRNILTPLPNEIADSLFFTEEEVNSFDPDLKNAFLRHAQKSESGFKLPYSAPNAIWCEIPSDLKKNAKRRQNLKRA